MKRSLLLGVFFAVALFSYAQTEPFAKRTVGTNFNNAWEVLYGPNDSLWVTENRSYRIRRINVKEDGVSTFGASTTLVDLFAQSAAHGITITQNTSNFPQGGLMGLAIHPNLYSSDPAVRNQKPWVYAAFVYTKGSCPGSNTSCIYSTKIVRYTYSGDALINPETIIDNLPGSSDHNSGRLVISPEIENVSPGGLHNQYRLYYTLGDMGAGQYLNTTRTQRSLVQNAFEGKVLRLNTESDGDAGQNAWVPNDNPFFNASTISAEDYVFTLGHRNAQGLAWGKVNGVNRLYSSEQMDRTDDEVNIIEKGRNYGWDRVSGYCDGNVNGYTIGTTAIGTTATTNEQFNCTSITNHKEPIFTMFTAQMSTINPSDNSQWPTVACSSIDFLGTSRIAGWSNSLFVTPLKKDFVYRLKLNPAGDGVETTYYQLFQGDGGRIRDMAISPNGRRFFIARDGGVNAGNGTIIAYNYTGTLLALTDKPGEGPAAAEHIDIYPNPVTNLLTVRGKKEFQKPLLAQLYDVTGSVVQSKSSFQNSFTVDISAKKSGIYFLKLYNGNGQLVETRKVVKQ